MAVSLKTVRMLFELPSADLLVTGRGKGLAVKFFRFDVNCPWVLARGKGAEVSLMKELAKKCDLPSISFKKLEKHLFITVWVENEFSRKEPHQAATSPIIHLFCQPTKASTKPPSGGSRQKHSQSLS